MATVAWTPVTFNGSGKLYTATVSTGDETAVLTLVNGENDVQFSVTGTIAGSTVTVQSTMGGDVFATAEGQAGTALALTTIGVSKVIRCPGVGVKFVVTAGTASGLVVNVYVPHKVRP